MTVLAKKTCERCGKSFTRKTRTSIAVFDKRRFCSRSCSTRRKGRVHRNVRKVFDANYKIQSGTNCWLWTHCIDNRGYGRIDINRQHYSAHRLSYTLYHGHIPKGFGVLHHCDTPICVNPDHLYAGTNSENMKDKVDRGRSLVGEKHPGSVLTEFDVCEIRESFKSAKVLAAIYGCSRSAIYHAKAKRTWSHII